MINKLSWLYFSASLILVVYFFLFSPKLVLAVTLFSTDFEPEDMSSWTSSGGSATATISAEQAKSGSRSIKIQHEKTSAYGYQKVIQNIEGGMFYEATVYGKTTDSNIDSFFIRVAWYSSSDGSGSQLSSPNDSNAGSSSSSEWTQLNIGTVQAPANANSAKLRLVLTSKTSGILAYAFFDDVVFKESVAPTPTYTPIPTLTPVNTPTPTLIPTKTPTPSPTKIPSATPSIKKELIDKKLSSVSGEILGESISDQPTNPMSTEETEKVLESKTNKTPLIFVILGIIIFVISCAILAFRIRKNGEKLNL